VLYSGVLEFFQDSIIKTCFVMHVKRWVAIEMKVEVVSSVCCWYIQTAASFFLQLNR